MNSLENYLLSLQINCYQTSVIQISQVQTRIWQSLQNSSSYAHNVIEEFELNGSLRITNMPPYLHWFYSNSVIKYNQQQKILCR